MANKAFNKNKSNLSFTLIELLVVIAIIGILAGIAIPAFQGATERAQIAKGLQFSDSLRNSLMINLISEWKFDDYLTNTHSTTAKDSWAKYNANTGTLYSGTSICSGPDDPTCPTWKTGSDCVSGSCLSFDGVDDYVALGSNASLNTPIEATIENWFKANDLTGARNYGVKRCQNDDLGWYITNYRGSTWTVKELASYILYTNTSNVTNYILPGYIGFETGQWYHVATVMKSNGQGLFYVNGILKSSVTATNFSKWGGKNAVANTTTIGEPGYRYPNGLIDEVRIYNAALPQAMIQQHYVQGLNSMLANKSISYEEYSQRMSEISNNLAIR